MTSRLSIVASFLLACDALNVDFIKDFVKLKRSKSVVFFLCDLSEARDVFITLNEIDISTQLVNLAEQDIKDPTQVLPRDNYAKTACIFDYSCTNSLPTLRAISTLRYFNTTYSWLFFAGNDSTVDSNHVLWKLKSIQMNSDVSVADPLAGFNGTAIEIADVYAPGRHLCKDIFRKSYGKWINGRGMMFESNYRPYYDRGNFNGLQLRGVTVIDKDNVTSNDVDRILSVPGAEQGVVSFIKYHYALLVILQDYHNFKIKFRNTRGWAGRLKSGYRLGLIGVLARNEADLATTGIFMRTNRHAEFDMIHQSWEFSAGFIYRMSSILSEASNQGNFFTPFDPSVWISLSFTLVIFLVIMKVSALFISKHLFNEPNVSIASYLVDIMGTMSQQGIAAAVSPRVTIRIILFSLLSMSVILYNYYTSTVVSGLLSSPGKGPQTIREVIDSPLTLAFLDIGYHRVLFRESKSPLIRELYEKKVHPPRRNNSIPVFISIRSAVPFLQKGGYAFHCELTEAFQEIADKFDANEICELRAVDGLFTDLKLLSFMLPKQSMYTEMFKITFMRITENGIIKRTLKIHQHKKPICQSTGRVNPVNISGVLMAFQILGAALILSAFIFVIEKIAWKRHQQRNLNVFLN